MDWQRGDFRKALLVLVLGAVGACLLPEPAVAWNNCSFTTTGTTMTLNGDCTTNETILVPDGSTLDGAYYTITAVDPPEGGHFKGAVVMNAGATAHVMNLVITTNALANVCDGGADRLRGIMFEGASGTITGNTVLNINQGPSGCQEGNAIEVRNAPFDGTHPATKVVEVSHNVLSAWQKTGIVCNGDVSVLVAHNQIGASATQANLAANSVQICFGGTGTVQFNSIAGNTWCGPSNYVATAVLLCPPCEGVTVSNNNIMEGNADVGIYIWADGAVIDNNRVFDNGPDCNFNGYDYGIGNWGVGNVVTNNKVRGFDIPYDGVEGGNNKTIPSPHQ